MLVICKNCFGDGRVPVNLGNTKIFTTCTTCKGNGQLHVPENKELCPDCNGSGSKNIKVAGIPYKTGCEKCNATGFIDK